MLERLTECKSTGQTGTKVAMVVGVTAAVGEMAAEEATIGEMEAEELGATAVGVMAAALEYRSVGPISGGRMEALS